MASIFAGEARRPDGRMPSGRTLIHFRDPNVTEKYARSVMRAALQRHPSFMRFGETLPEVRLQYIDGMRIGALSLPPALVSSALRDENVLVAPERVLHAALVMPGSDDDVKDTYSIFGQIGLNATGTKSSGQNVTVALLDSGTPTHSDLHPRTTAEANFTFRESTPDNYGHATHCAGIISGPRTANGRNGYGIAPQVNMIYGRVLDRNGDGLDMNVIEGINWAIRQKADIIVLCFSSPVSLNATPDIYYEVAAEVARSQNILIVGAAGNKTAGSAEPVHHPANCPRVPAVGAIDRKGTPAPFSCTPVTGGDNVDLLAPGELVPSAWLDNKYRRVSGTSMACAAAAGVAALWAEGKPGDLFKALSSSLRGGVVQAP
ncbi:MAG TPA: S8 family serine peptidase [Thermoanaerobaculia bacterium]|nr:S8 family serine peptidase [Thermoanaerobaculia bacterium]